MQCSPRIQGPAVLNEGRIRATLLDEMSVVQVLFGKLRVKRVKPRLDRLDEPHPINRSHA